MSVPEHIAIRCASLSKSYDSTEALKGLDLTVPANSIFGLLGPNGAGKSTTMKLLTRQIAPTSGTAWVAGVQITDQRSDARSRIGYLSEQPAFYSWMTGYEFLRFVGELFGLAPTLSRKRCHELLELVDLTGAAKKKIGAYSRGMRQRLGIAQALMNQPEVLLLDEPISALDPIGRKDVLELLAGLKEQTTVFFSSHILEDVDRICDEVAVLNHGVLLVQAPTQALKEQYTQPMITIELEADASVLISLLKQESYIQDVQVMGAQARVLVTDLELAKRCLPECLVNAHLPLLRYEVALPTLEDVFVHLIDEVTTPSGETK
jgi:ABC-2 type transport system ATP-binding protein